MSKRIKYSLLIICLFFFSALNVFAANSLLGVDVKQTETGSYNIVLKVDDSVNIKKIAEEDNLTLVLDSMLPADSVEINYDNALDLKNVMVQKKNSENTMILFQGKNIENAVIYTKDISTGQVKLIDGKMNSLNNYLYIANVKYLSYCMAGIFAMFLIMLSFRPRQVKYSYNVKKQYRTVKHTTINKINKKSHNQQRYVPSINYRVANMSVPKDFVSINRFEEEKIRKVS